MKQQVFLKYVVFFLFIILLCSGLSVSVLSADTGSDSVLLLTSFSPSVFSSNHEYSSIDQELRENIEFYCYSDRDDSLDGKSQSMLHYFSQSHVATENNILTHDLSGCVSRPYDSSESLEDENIADISVVDPKNTPWPMKCHDNRHTGLSPYSTVDNNGAELWKFEAYGCIEDGAVINDDGTIYFGDNFGYIYALNSDGSLKWRYDEAAGGTVTCTPAIAEDGTIYVGDWDHYLRALNPDGTLKWKIEIGTTASSPAIGEDGTIYTGTMGHKIYAINPDGTVKWQYRTKGTIIGGPAIDRDETIYIGSMDSYFYAVNPNGSLKWKFKTDDCIKGPPSIGTDGTIYIGSYDGYLYALFPDGSLKWKCRIGYGTETNPSIGPDGAIFVGGEELYAVNPDGTLRWIFELQSNEIIFQSSPAISADGIIYVGTNIDGTSGGDIIAVNPDGTLRWRHRIANEWVDSSPCIDENGIVYIGSSSITDTDPIRPHGFLYAFGPSDVNNPPDQPTIQGDTNGKIGETYTYTISGTDPDNDMISFFVDWGDNSDSGWQGPYSSGTSIELSHSWSEKDSYIIKAKAMDSEGSESTWATLEVSMPKNKDAFDSLLARFFQGYPWLFSLLENLL